MDSKKYLSIVFILYMSISCGEKERKASPETFQAFQSILSENQKVFQSILEDSEKVPELQGLISSLETARSTVSEEGLKRAIEEETRILKDSMKLDKDAFFDGYSRFVEHMTVSMKTEGVTLPDYNRFYCPMVKKYWLAKGTEVENPFAPEMRDCGEISN